MRFGHYIFYCIFICIFIGFSHRFAVTKHDQQMAPDNSNEIVIQRSFCKRNFVCFHLYTLELNLDLELKSSHCINLKELVITSVFC